MARVMRSVSSPPVIPLASQANDQPPRNTPKRLVSRGSDDTDEALSPLFPDAPASGSLKEAEATYHQRLREREADMQRLLKATLDQENCGGSMTSESKVNKRESYKAQRKNYRREKKRVARELLSTLKDPTIVVLADWLKVRGTLKGWTKLWAVLRPGLLLLYKSPHGKHWVGTVLLAACELIERPSKKDGFCFKLFHPLEQSIWAARGPRGETRGAIVQPLPVTHLIFRAPSESAGKCWMDAMELALRCSSLLARGASGGMVAAEGKETTTQWNESDLEKHFDHGRQNLYSILESPDTKQICPQNTSVQDLEDDNHTDDNRAHSSDTESEPHVEEEEEDEEEPLEPPYMENDQEELGMAGDAGQTEEVAEENKSLIWSLLKQVRPGMDLSKVVLPTFILEPRSFLDKLTDYYYHADILTRAVQEEDPFDRMKMVVEWYLSGFYKKPKGLKKPYNPILGETFRCFWRHPDTGSRTFYIAEQVSHHPPISAFYVTNRQDGFCISGSILAKSKFYGNSLSAILDGTARLTLLARGEDYTLTMPYAHCKGILVGTLTMELGGKVDVTCEKTGYKAEIEFKLKPFLGGSEQCNLVVGKIKLGKETLAILQGHWDDSISLVDKRTEEEHVLWSASPEVKARRLHRYTVPAAYQEEFESERLWQHVSAAIMRGDQQVATEEKTVLEEAQRRAVKEREAKMESWNPRHFVQDLITGEWLYKFADSRPWDRRTDTLQYESNFVIQTRTRHRTPAVRTHSILSMDFPSPSGDRRALVATAQTTFEGSESSSPELPHDDDPELSPERPGALHTLLALQRDANRSLAGVQRHLERLSANQRRHETRLLLLVGILLALQLVLRWIPAPL